MISMKDEFFFVLYNQSGPGRLMVLNKAAVIATTN